MGINSIREAFTLRRAAQVALADCIGVRADADDRVIEEHRTRQEELLAMSQSVIALADRESRELTGEEQDNIRNYQDESDRLETQIQLRERVLSHRNALATSRGRQVDPAAADPTGGELPTVDPEGNDQNDDAAATAAGTRSRSAAAQNLGRSRAAAQPTHVQTRGLTQPANRIPRGTFGFRGLGEFAQCVRNAMVNHVTDVRLQAAATTYGSEGIGSDGGFAVPPDFRTAINALVTAEGTLFALTDNSPTESTMIVMTVDETTSWGTAGVQVYTRAEAAAMTPSKPKLKDHVTKLNEVYAFVPMTDELLQDAPLLAAHLTTKAGEAINFAMNNYIINGTGVGQPLGIMSSPCLVTQDAVGSQTTDTVHAENIIAMWGRMPAGVRGRSVWLCNQDVEVQLMRMGMPVYPPASTTPVGGMPVYMPPGGLAGVPYGTLLGRPIFVTEACAKLGDLGDIVLAFMGGYFMPYKSGGIRADISMHLYFDQGITAFRWTFRIGGQPWLSAPIDRKNGTNTLSHFVTLAAR